MISRGDIWWVDLPEPEGSEPGDTRPVLVVQADNFNNSKISTVVAVCLTSSTRHAEAPGNVLLPSDETELPDDSVANVSQIVTLDRSFLRDKVNTIGGGLMSQVDDGLRLVLSL